MKIFKIEACGDVVYVEAADKAAANERLTATIGKIPNSLLTFTEVDALPEGEEFL